MTILIFTSFSSERWIQDDIIGPLFDGAFVVPRLGQQYAEHIGIANVFSSIEGSTLN